MIETTVGRVIFNQMLPKGMLFYNIPMRSSELARVISDCYQTLGRRATIELLDDMNRLGFRNATSSGLSFATDDLITPGQQIEDHRRGGERGPQEEQALSARHHHRHGAATTRCSTPGPTPARSSPRR